VDLHSPTTFLRAQSGTARDRSPSRSLTCHLQLSQTQQRALFRRLRRPETSPHERDQLRSRIVSGTLQVVVHCLRGINGRQRLAELVQEGVLALARAVDTFAGRKQNDFLRFAGACVARCLHRILRRWARERELLVNDAIEELSDPEHHDAFSAAAQTELEERLETMMRHLPTDQQRVLRLRFGIGAREAQSREEIGKELRLEPQRVHYLEERALSTLRRRVARRSIEARGCRNHRHRPMKGLSAWGSLCGCPNSRGHVRRNGESGHAAPFATADSPHR
jgi:RNA polymerase sigma factor (sigma-70 family)